MSGGQRTLFYLLSFFSPAFGMILGIVCLNDVDFDKKSVGKMVYLSLFFPLFSALFVGLHYLLFLPYLRIVNMKRYWEPNSLLDELGSLSMGNTIFLILLAACLTLRFSKIICRIRQSSFV